MYTINTDNVFVTYSTVYATCSGTLTLLLDFHMESTNAVVSLLCVDSLTYVVPSQNLHSLICYQISIRLYLTLQCRHFNIVLLLQ
jgi:hypothetical protein